MTKERKSTVNDVPENSSRNSSPNSSPNSSGDENKAEDTGQPDVKEHGGRDGPDPARYGDWEIGGKCVDF